MVDLRVYVEGSGELGFVQEMLVSHLEHFDVCVQASRFGHLAGKPSGGIRSWDSERGVRRELYRALQQSSDRYPLYVTTMVDYYALPLDWPNRNTASALPKPERSSSVESGMLAAMRVLLGDDRRIDRFIPYVSLHELEALILSKPDALLAEFPGCEAAVKKLKEEIGTAAPEDINDGKDSAPSKRITDEQVLPEYSARKSAAAVNTLKNIGLEHLRAACPHFGQWLGRLESLAGA